VLTILPTRLGDHDARCLRPEACNCQNAHALCHPDMQETMPGEVLRERGPKAPSDHDRLQRGWTQQWDSYWQGSNESTMKVEQKQQGGERMREIDLTHSTPAKIARARAHEDEVEFARERLQKIPESQQERVASAKAPHVQLKEGICIPQLGLGTWKSEPGEVRVAVEHALRNGWRHIDCASVYQNESEVGDALSEVCTTTSLNREDVFVTSKLWNDSHSYGSVRQAVMRSLKHLSLRQLDLLLIHWPIVTGNTGDSVQPPLEETWRALECLVCEVSSRTARD